MSTYYETLVEAVGPAHLIAKLKATLLHPETGLSSPGLVQTFDTPNYVSFVDVTSESALSLSQVNQMRPAINSAALQDRSLLQGIFIRVELITDCSHYREWFIGDNVFLFALTTELDQEAPPTDGNPYPQILHSTEGDPVAWERALTTYGVWTTHGG